MILQIDFQYTLAEFVKENGTRSAATSLGVTRAAIRQMLANRRRILVKKIGRRWCYAEVKPFKHGKSDIRSQTKHIFTPVQLPTQPQELAHAS